MSENKESDVLENIAGVIKHNASNETRSFEPDEYVFEEDKRPSLRMKSIGTWNVWGMPWFSSDLSKRMSEWSNYLHDSMAENQQLDEEDLVVSCVQEAWGYRVGMLGWPVMYAGYKNSNCVETYGLSKFINKHTNRNIHGNDHELLSGVWSVGARSIPGLNAGVWDPKRTIARGLLSRNKELMRIQKEAEIAKKKAEEAEKRSKKAKEQEIERMRKKAEKAKQRAEELAKKAREAEEMVMREASRAKLEPVEAKDSETGETGEDKVEGVTNQVEELSTITEEKGEDVSDGEKASVEEVDVDVEESIAKDKKPLILRHAYGAGSSNKSVSGMFNMGSIQFKPLLDSGCAIYANKPAKEHGFERWNTWGDAGWMENMANKGIVWAYFEAPNRQRGITVMNLHIAGASPKGTDVAQLKQLVFLKANLEKRFSSRVMKYETYVGGDFNIEFGKRNEVPEIMEKWNILRRVGFNIVSESPIGSTSASDKEIDFVLYAPDEINHEDTIKDFSQVKSMFEECAYDTRPVEKTSLSDHWLVRVDVEYGDKADTSNSIDEDEE